MSIGCVSENWRPTKPLPFGGSNPPPIVHFYRMGMLSGILGVLMLPMSDYGV